MIIFILSFFLFCSYNTDAQNTSFYTLDSISNSYMEQGLFDEAIPFALQSVELTKKQFGANDTLYAKALDRLGTLYYYKGRYKETEQLFLKCVQIRKAHFGNQHPQYAGALVNLALVSDMLEKHEESLRLLLESMKIDSVYYGVESIEYSISLNNLGNTYYSLNQFNLAEYYYLKSLKIDKKILGINHPDYATSIYNLGAAYEQIGAYDKAENCYKEAIQLLKANKSSSHDYSFAISYLSALYLKKGLIDQALALQQESLALDEKNNQQGHPDYARKLGIIASSYKALEDFVQAEVYYNKSLEAYKKIVVTESANYINTLLSLADVYVRTNRYQQAKTICLQTLEMVIQKKGKNSSQYPVALANLANVYSRLSNFEESIRLNKEALEASKQIYGNEHIEIATFNFNIAKLYSNHGQHKTSIDYYNNAAKLYLKIHGGDYFMYATALQHLAIVYFSSNQRNLAEPLLLKALEIKKINFGNNHYLLSDCLKDIAVFYQKTQPQKALHYITKAIQYNCRMELDSVGINNNLLEILKKHQFWDSKIVIDCIYQLYLVQLELYEQTEQLDYLKAAFETIQSYAFFTQKLQRVLNNNDDKLKTLKDVTFSSYHGIVLAERLYRLTKDKAYLNQVITFSENNKSAILISSISNNQALSFGEIPDSLMVKEYALQKQIAYLEKSIHELKGDSTERTNLQRSLVKSILEQSQLKAFFKQNYPKYNDLKYNINPVELGDIQAKLLDKTTALLEYFFYKENLYLILITSNNIQLIPLQISSTQLRQQVKKLRESLSNYSSIIKKPVETKENFSQVAALLYTELVKPAKPLLQGIQKLIIIPDGSLGHIPFEVLLTSSVDKKVTYKTMPYLLKDYTINYNYSAALLLENLTAHKKNNNGLILGFAANYSPVSNNILGQRSATHQKLRPQLQELPAAKSEVASLEQLFSSGTFYFDNNATESNFKKNASNYSILHLAMHGIVNPENPLSSSLAFTENGDTLEDNFLEAHEISHLQLNNELVVLSACETGYGKFEQGEGVVSLARSFMYAGVPSMVVSLWQVNDGSTALIMQYFYQNLAAGQHKDEALRNAKLSYLEQANEITSHPAFWSPFIQLGEASPILLKQNSRVWIWWILGLLATATVLFAVYRKALFNKSSR